MRQVDAAGTSVPVCFDSISKFIRRNPETISEIAIEISLNHG
jgi:hypothetical protein